MIKYKSEEFLSDSQHRSLAISGVLCGCAALDMLRAEFKMDEVMSDHMSFLIPAIFFAVLSVFLLLRCILKAVAYWKDAMESRRNYMQNGKLSHGKITDAGGGYYEKTHYRQQHVRRAKSRYFRVWENKWWADIEYVDETKGTYVRHRVMGLNKNGKLHHLIGRDVEIYHLDKFIYVDFK